MLKNVHLTLKNLLHERYFKRFQYFNKEFQFSNILKNELIDILKGVHFLVNLD